MQQLLENTAAYKLLKAEGEKQRFCHAYLLTLSDGRNLRAAAKAFAKVFFMQSPAFSRIADLIDKESFSDCLFYPETDKKFAVEDAERVGEECALQPVEGARKLIVIADFADANAASQNKLLKLLEQPPEDVAFLLCATSVYPVLQTVLSRVERLEIPPFATEEVGACLSRVYGTKYAQDDIAVCAAACDGVVGVAQSMLEGGGYKTLLADAFSLALCTADKLPSVVKRVGETKQKRQLLSLLRILYRDALLVKTGQRKHVLLQSEKENLGMLAQKRSVAALLYAQEKLTDAEREVAFNAVFPQCIETFAAAVLARNEKL